MTKDPNCYILSIIREDGRHITSFRVTEAKLKTLIKDNF